MPGSKHITESAIHDFLRGAGTGDDRLDVALEAMAAVPPAPTRPDDLIVRLVAATGDGVSTPPKRVREPHSKPLPRRWRRRTVFTTILSSIVGKIAIAGVALATTTGGLAAADALPAPAQQVVSDAAARLGITLPAPDNDADDTAATAEDIDDPTDPSETSEDERIAPQLPDEASDVAKRVIEIVFGGNPESEGREFGQRVADTASDGNSRGSDSDDSDGRGQSGGGDDNGPPDTIPGPPDQIPAGPPSNTGGRLPSPSSPRP